jgi:hypothetical protein
MEHKDLNSFSSFSNHCDVTFTGISFPLFMIKRNEISLDQETNGSQTLYPRNYSMNDKYLANRHVD